MGEATLSRVIALTQEFRPDFLGDGETFTGSTSVCQDAMIYSIDVDDYVDLLEGEFGPVIREIPWLEYTDQTFSFRGCGCVILPFVFVWKFLTWPFRGGKFLPRGDPRKFPRHLTLGHIAAVIDAGHWFEP